LWLVTRGAVAAGGNHTSINVASSALWGLGKVISLEHPDLWGGLVDLSMEAPLDEAARLAEEIQDPQGEEQIVFRAGERHVSRLIRSKPAPAQEVALHSDGTYLITGGLGALGLKTAQWLVEKGARHLVLLGRRGPSKAAREIIAQLEQAGGRIQIEQADVCDKGQMARVFEKIAKSGFALRGIIHAAGVIEDGILLKQTWERFKRVMSPKVTGTWNLHVLSRNLKLDFFVCFSSMASILGSPGQANYAAANAFMDALVHYRRHQGLSGISINWGPLSGGGMANMKSRKLQARLGVLPLSPGDAVSALNYLLGAVGVQTVVVKIDWAVHKGSFHFRKARSFLEQIEASVQESVEQPCVVKQTDLLQRIEAAPEGEQKDLLVTYLQSEVARIMGFELSQLPKVDEGFFEMGMDSLMAMELKYSLDASLDKSLPLSMIFNHPTIRQLGDHIIRDVLRRELLDATRKKVRNEKNHVSIEGPKTEPIAIIGLGCRFPGADTPEDFWQSLLAGTDAVREVPSSRWDVDAFYDPDPDVPGKISTRKGAFLDQVDQFDPLFFGISPKEAMHMDPQHRLLLEVSWEALEHAGQDPRSLACSRTGVFVGIGQNDYSNLNLHQSKMNRISAYYGTGNGHCFISGRLSYILGLQGPSMAIDTACSSSLVATHLACQSLRAEECDMALAGGVQLILTPEASIFLSKTHALSSDGRCKAFDAGADGYGRGEGGGVVVLKRLSDAVRNRDHILALIRGSAVNHDGPSSGFTVPNGLAQQELITKAIDNADVETNHIDYVEAHATGTVLGDPIEVESLGAVYGRNRNKNHPLFIGSVKANIGHLEAAAGIAGLIKVVLALQHKEIPPQVHFRQPNPYIAWQEFPLMVPTEPIHWAAGTTQRMAGVNAFGLSGTNASIIVEEAPGPVSVAPAVERPVHVLTLSAKTQDALTDLSRRYADYLAANPESVLGDVCFTANTGRSHFSHRLAVMAESCEELCARLGEFASGEVPTGIATGRKVDTKRLKTVFLFFGQGAQYAGMGRRLYETHAVFRRIIERCDALLKSDLKISLIDMLYHENKSPCSIDDTTYAQPALFTVECALFELWKSFGIEPSAVMGHGGGEYAAACAAGVFSLEEGLALVTARARLMQQLPKNGAIKPMLAEFEQIARQVSYASPRLSIVSHVTGGFVKEEIATPDYWVRHIRHPLKFEDGIKTLEQNGYTVFVELSAKPELQKMAQQSLSGKEAMLVPGLRKGRSDWSQLLSSLAQLYVHGLSVDWQGVDREYPYRKVVLPTYPFQRRRCWIDTDANGKAKALSSFPEQRLQDNADPHPIAGDHFETSVQNILYEVEWIPQEPQKHTSASPFVPDLPELENHLRQRCDSLSSAATNVIYKEVLDKIEALSFGYILKAFQKMGWRFEKGHIFLLDDIMKDLGIGAQYKKLMNRLLEILAEEGVLKKIGKRWETGLIPTFQDPSRKNKALLALYPMAIGESTLLDRCGSNLAEILQGKCDPLELLFPEGDLTSLTMLYQQSPGAQMMNTLVQEAVFKAMDKLPDDHVLRILEIGGGTGGTTSHILPLLSTKQTEYLFTDISSVFLTAAQTKFADYSFVQYQVLDIEQPPSDQGIDPYTFDLVIAANVLHATKDLRQTLNHVQQLLKPGGIVALLEGTAPQRRLDLIFGLTEGWWRFKDFELRPGYPLLSLSRWQTFLEEMGFKQTIAVSPDQERKGGVLQQAVILAQTAQASPEKSISAAKRWLIFADRQGVAKELTALLRSRGDLCTLVSYGKAYKRLSKQKYVINPSRLEDTERLFKDYGEQDPFAVHAVIHLWSLDIVSPESMTVSDLEIISQNGCGSLLHVVQVLSKQGFHPPPSLWVVTRAAQPVGREPRLPGLAHSVLWGLGKIVALEHPEMKCVRIDLDFDDPIHCVQSLFDEMCAHVREDQVAFRKGVRYVSRLENHEHPVTSQQPVKLNKEGTYLITGGLGGLGLLVAGWLVERGARSIALVGRHRVSRHARSQLSELTHKGAEVKVFQADVSDMEQMKAVFEEIETSLACIRGVIHAAGILDDGILRQQSWDRFANVFRPKVGGAWNLHRLTHDRALDFFIMFSSAASLFGSPGQANHAAANAFLDALAYYRQARGLPGLAINWGAWAKVGAAARKRVEAPMLMKGIGTIEPEKGLKVFEQLMHKSIAQIGVVPIEWEHFLQQFPGGVHPPFFASIAYGHKLQSKIEQSFNEQDELLLSLRELDPPARFSSLLNYLNQIVAKTLRLKVSEMDVQTPLNDMGIDSLMALQLTNQLKKDLRVDVPMVKFIEDVSTADLATLVDRRLCELVADEPILSENEASNHTAVDKADLDLPGVRVLAQDALETPERLDQLSDVEVNALLQKMLSE
jgi:acyl transferase domain-containing protein